MMPATSSSIVATEHWINCYDRRSKSEEAARELVAIGYTNVRHYEGGKQDWMKHDLPVEGERSES